MRLVRFAVFLLLASTLLPAYKVRGQQNSVVDSGKWITESGEREAYSLRYPLSTIHYSVGEPRYIQPWAARYRLLFGVGGNDALRNDAPLSFIGSAGYQLEHSLYSASFITSTNNTRQPPRNTRLEFDLLYGYAIDEEIARYEASPQSFHTSLSAGIGFDSYNIRWRFGRRGTPIDTTSIFHPNIFQYSIAFPVQLQAIYEPFRFAGIGATFFLSVSKLTPSYGGAIVIEARY